MAISNLVKQGSSSIIAPLAIEDFVNTSLAAGQTETLVEVTGKGIIDEAIVYSDSTNNSRKCRLIIEVDGVEVFNHLNTDALTVLSGLTSTHPSIKSDNVFVFRVPYNSQQYTAMASNYSPAPTSFSGGRVVIMTNPVVFKSSVRVRFKNEGTNSITLRLYGLKGAYTS